MTTKVAVFVFGDEALILLDIVFQLEPAGYRVYAATNADAAIKVLTAHRLYSNAPRDIQVGDSVVCPTFILANV